MQIAVKFAHEKKSTCSECQMIFKNSFEAIKDFTKSLKDLFADERMLCMDGMVHMSVHNTLVL